MLSIRSGRAFSTNGACTENYAMVCPPSRRAWAVERVIIYRHENTNPNLNQGHFDSNPTVGWYRYGDIGVRNSQRYVPTHSNDVYLPEPR